MAHEKERKPGKVSRITFEPAKGGVISHTETRYDRGGQGGGPLFDSEDETGIHKSMASAVSHLKEHMGHAFGKVESEPEGEDMDGEEAED